ncbi:hypothetical protein RRG08_032255 [Elysia crispata]|uniref:Uncharacterized protein n=1 Tax=Elysia crispata TaxID=231223 RepID=A0AAE1AZU0_9GAST|nr:hypothetical protein RRG08_032255 [Elysia crispata]
MTLRKGDKREGVKTSETGRGAESLPSGYGVVLGTKFSFTGTIVFLAMFPYQARSVTNINAKIHPEFITSAVVRTGAWLMSAVFYVFSLSFFLEYFPSAYPCLYHFDLTCRQFRGSGSRFYLDLGFASVFKVKTVRRKYTKEKCKQVFEEKILAGSGESECRIKEVV